MSAQISATLQRGDVRRGVGVGLVRVTVSTRVLKTVSARITVTVSTFVILTVSTRAGAGFAAALVRSYGRSTNAARGKG